MPDVEYKGYLIRHEKIQSAGGSRTEVSSHKHQTYGIYYHDRRVDNAISEEAAINKIDSLCMKVTYNLTHLDGKLIHTGTILGADLDERHKPTASGVKKIFDGRGKGKYRLILEWPNGGTSKEYTWEDGIIKD